MAEKPDEAVEMTKEPNNAVTLNVNNEAAASATRSNGRVEYLDPPVKSDCDDNAYRVLKLRNGLTVLLTSHLTDEKGSKSRKFNGCRDDDKNASNLCDTSKENTMFSASGIVICTLTIDVGCLSDSAENPCIAELLSKVVLTASKKYPTPYSFEDFLHEQHCDVLVYCDKERTLFSFSSQKHLREALHRFVNCFIEPFLIPEVVEIEKNLDSDAVMIEEAAIRNLVDPACVRAKNYLFGLLASKCDNNPASHLILGRNKVLHSQSADTLLQGIEKFMKRHYSAHRMIVSLKAHQLSLDELEEHAKTYFSQIPSNGLPPIDFTRFTFDKCFDSPEFRMIYEIQASCEKLDNLLELHWSMPSRTTTYKSKPTEYLSWVLQHSGKGSLIWYLSKKNWCTDLSCATGNTCLEPNSIFSLISLSLSVTDEGQKNYKKILDAVYSYINLLRSEGPQRTTYEEIREKLDSQFQRNDQVLRCLCNKHSSLLTMHNHTSAEYLNGSIVLSEYDPAAIKQCLELMSPEKANIIVCQKKYGTIHSLSEKWDEVHNRVENVKYRRSTIPEAWINHWKNVEPMPELKLPVVDDTTTLEPEDSRKYPVKIHSDDLCEVYQLDTEFETLSNVNYLFCNHVSSESAENAFMVDALACLLRMAMREELTRATYPVSDVCVRSDFFGLLVYVRGHQNITLLTEAVAKRAGTLANDVTGRVFAGIKASLTAQYLDSFCSSDELIPDVTGRTIRRVQWLLLDKYNASSGVYLGKFKRFARYFFDRIFVKCLATGYFTRSEIIESVRRSVRTLKCRPLLPNPLPQPSDYEFPPGTRCCRFQSTDIDDVTTVKNYYQFRERSIKQDAIIACLQVTMVSRELKLLRARQNLDDYDITMGRGGRSYGYSLGTKKTQSGTITRVAKIEATIEEFRKAMHKWFESLTTTEWEKVKAACMKATDLKNLTFNESLIVDWHEIASGEYIFNRTTRNLKALNELSIEDLRRSMMYVTSNDSRIRKLSVQAVSRKEYAAGSADARQEQSELRLNFLTNLPGEEVRSDDYYITNIASDTYPQLIRS